MFKLELLPACEGDCLILSWLDGAITRRILIDGGRLATADDVKTYAKTHDLGTHAFELFIITHIDRDHIEGAVALLDDAEFRPLVKEVWFNDRKDLDYAPTAPGFETFGAKDGVRITNLLAEHKIPNNISFDPASITVGTPPPLTAIACEGGLTLTVVSPDQGQLAALAKPWDDTIATAPPGWEDLGEPELIDIDFLVKQPFKGDTAKPNGSSIAVIASYDDRHVLLTGDAHVPRLLSSIEAYKAANPNFKGFNLVKAPHHGSKANISLELVRAANCRHWAISTNGSQFKHPDKEGIARIIGGSPPSLRISFNYRSVQTEYWENALKPPHAFTSAFGQDGYIAIDIE